MFQENLRELFLRKFIKELITDIEISDIEKLNPREKEDFKENENLERDSITPIGIRPKKKEEKIILNLENKKLDAETISSLSPTPLKKFGPITATKLTKNPKIIRPLKIPQKIKSTPIVPPARGYPDLGKLNLLIADIGVEGIECVGPNKNIVVKKEGRVQRTEIILTKEEIRQLVNFFSIQTKIPLTQGTFKAVLGNLILTAITSDFAGAKFILQKKTPLSF